MEPLHFSTVESMVKSLKPDSPVYCFRPQEFHQRAREFLDFFPGRVLYAVKCNPHPLVLRSLYEAGVHHYDTASLEEIILIRKSFPDADCYFMHPVKPRGELKKANGRYAVAHYVIDNEGELEKLVAEIGKGDGRVVLVRMKTPSYDVAIKLSEKFGAPPEEAVGLLRMVKEAGFQPGLAFHIGSQCREPAAFTDAIRIAGEVNAKADVDLHYFDIGGGFPIQYADDRVPVLRAYFDAIAAALKRIQLRKDCVIMCEPGRALVGSGCSVVVRVLMRKADTIYINDGIYHSFSESFFGKVKFPVRAVPAPGRTFSKEAQEFSIFGPTCDSLDILEHKYALPDDIQEGDWLEFGQMGAYSNALRTMFNGIYPNTFVTVNAPPLAV
ncbi:MAG: type III PLP-dependent enzyme [Gammaproteobacteria bacterium]